MAGTNDIPDLFILRLIGRSGADAPIALPQELGVEAMNIDWYKAPIGRKRGGSANVPLNGFMATSVVSALARYTPLTSEGSAELWAVESGLLTVMRRLAGSTTWATVTLSDPIQDHPEDVTFAQLNGKLFMAYNSAVNRLHVWDGTTHRRVGLAIPSGAPTIVETGSGVITDNRRYRTAVTTQVSGVTTRRSELSAVSATATLTGENATATLVGRPNDGETHWELYAASDDDQWATYFLIATTIISTLTAVDNNTKLIGGGFGYPADSGQYTLPPSAKYLIADDARLVMAGAWETTGGLGYTTPSPRRVWWTPVLGSSDIGDDERITMVTDQRNYLDVELDITGIGGPVIGNIYVFAYRAVWKLVLTGLDDVAFVRYTVSRDVGCIRHQTIVIAEDNSGEPALYWLSHIGPYRAGADGMQYLGLDIEDIWATVNLDATTAVGHGVYHRDKHQVWWWVATGASNDPDTKIVFDVRLGIITETANLVRGGWSRGDGEQAIARCSVMFSKIIGVSMTRAVIPYIGKIDGTTPRIWQCDTTDLNDAGTAYRAYLKTRPYAPWGIGKNGGLRRDPFLLAKSATGVVIEMKIDRDYGREFLTSEAFLNPVGSETRGTYKFEGQSLAQASVVQFQIGDAAAVSNNWVLDAVVIPLRSEGPR